MLGVAVVQWRRLSAGEVGAGGVLQQPALVVSDLLGSKPGLAGIHQAES